VHGTTAALATVIALASLAVGATSCYAIEPPFLQPSV
jgi:hypothetical protein